MSSQQVATVLLQAIVWWALLSAAMLLCIPAPIWLIWWLKKRNARKRIQPRTWQPTVHNWTRGRK